MNTEATPREVGLSEGLGALPEPALHMVADENGVSVYPAFYTADQMRAYAAAAVAAERERWIGALEKHAMTATAVDARGLLSMVASLSGPNVIVEPVTPATEER